MLNLGIRHGRLRVCPGQPEITFAIQSTFLLPARLCAVVRDASFCGTLPAMAGTATKGATQIVAPGIGRLSEKEDPAMSTSLQIGSQVRVGSKGRSQGIVVGNNGTANFATTVPVRAKFIKRRDFY